ncbi:trichothecene 3-O-acetyltransferase [Tothia fuscella]|uniref:Trichothecene 3-O-acetyltransferase n=1 Tax=Tothia fuscella TaxID=1048955 RepID=A0A9P4NJE5_9PEZI|nr:trichothecene 3-O-acetyltransferase [Tothia fuscella]
MSDFKVQRQITEGLELDIFGQQLTKVYTQIISIFPVEDESQHESIINIIASGLAKLSAAFPWIAGQVVCDGASESNTGSHKIIPLEATPQLTVKDLRDDPEVPAYADFKRANFPIRMLGEDLLAPRKTLMGLDPQNDYAIFLVQITWVEKGMFLTFLGHHQAMDGTGQGQMIGLLSKACNGKKLTSEELSTGNLLRKTLIPFIENYVPGPEIEHQIVDHSASPPSLAPSIWANFTFSAPSLAALKKLADSDLRPNIPFVSTDDAVSAFIWQSVQRARSPRLNSETCSRFMRAIDVRSFVGIPKTYPGVLSTMLRSTLPLQSLLTLPLGVIASTLRSQMDGSSTSYNVRSYATYLNTHQNKSAFSIVAGIDTSKDIMLSSWAKMNTYELDFGLGLGKPVAVRRPGFTPTESLMYLMPRSLDGENTAVICLRDEDMERLKVDEEFGKYARFDG